MTTIPKNLPWRDTCKYAQVKYSETLRLVQDTEGKSIAFCCSPEAAAYLCAAPDLAIFAKQVLSRYAATKPWITEALAMQVREALAQLDDNTEKRTVMSEPCKEAAEAADRLFGKNNYDKQTAVIIQSAMEARDERLNPRLQDLVRAARNIAGTRAWCKRPARRDELRTTLEEWEFANAT